MARGVESPALGEAGRAAEQPAPRRGPAKRFQDLVAWQKAHQFVLAAYALVKQFPKHESFGLTSQLRRAAVSVAANLAEGFGERGPRNRLRYLGMARASLEECRYYLILANDLNYADTRGPMQQLEDASRVLLAYIGAIRRDVNA
jgi:four helix bundle protein